MIRTRRQWPRLSEPNKGGGLGGGLDGLVCIGKESSQPSGFVTQLEQVPTGTWQIRGVWKRVFPHILCFSSSLKYLDNSI